MIVAAIVLAAAGGTWFALERVASDAERQAQSPAPVVEAPRGAAQPGEIAAWPAGSSAFTVVLLTADSEAAARVQATAASNAGVSVGVLDARSYPTLEAGPWVVFAGRFETRPAAEQEAARYAATGFPSAEAAFVSETAAETP